MLPLMTSKGEKTPHSITTIQVLEGIKLASKDPNGLSDPYCIIGASDSNNTEFWNKRSCVRSETIKHNLSPRWKQAIYAIDDSVQNVRVEVWDWDADKLEDDSLGFAIITVNSFMDGQTKLVKLLPRNKGDEVSGDIWVKISRVFSHPNTIRNYEDRVVRIFLSSTFLDMHEERENIMRKTMVSLQRFCYERGVTLAYIDMRWGITDEQANGGMTILRCLQSVDLSRPYFVGMLGHRYGWHQEVDNKDTLLTQSFQTAEAFPEYKWIQNFRTSSVTELEILHGFMFHQHQAKGHVFFYLRDPIYNSSIEPSKIKSFVDSSAFAVRKLADLKSAIRAKEGCIVREYKHHDEITDLLQMDLETAINTDFPLTAETELQRELRSHINFAHHQCSIYYPCEQYFGTIEATIEDDVNQGNYIQVLGESGSGKSAILAQWWKKQTQNNTRPVFVHFAGASIYASDFTALLLRLLAEINSLLGPDALNIPHNDKLIDAVYSFLVAISRKAGITLIIDDVNQLEEKYQDLNWLPDVLPPHINVIFSTSAKSTIPAEKTITHIPVLALQTFEKQLMIESQLSLYNKNITAQFMDQILEHKLSTSPLFLKTVVLEMCITGFYMNFKDQLDHLLAATSIPMLFSKIIIRWEKDFGNLSKEVLMLILCSRSGLSELSILAITQAPSQLFLRLMDAIKPTLTTQNGNLNFAHSSLRQAIETQYSTEDTLHSYKKLSQYWKSTLRHFTTQTAFEYPWILEKMVCTFSDSEALHGLLDLLLDLDKFLVFYANDHLKADLHKYWQLLAAEDPELNVGKLYEKQFENYQFQSPIFCTKLVEEVSLFLISAGYCSSAQAIIGAYLNSSTEHERYVPLLNVLGKSYRKQAKLVKAFNCHNRALSVCEKLQNKLLTAATIKHIANTHHQDSKFEIAVALFQQAESLKVEFLGNNHHRSVATILNNLGCTLMRLEKLEEALERLLEAKKIRENLFGRNHASVATSHYNMSLAFIRQNNYESAIFHANESFMILANLLGPAHPNTATALIHLGYIYNTQGNVAPAIECQNKALAIFVRLYGEVHPFVATTCNNLGQSYMTLEQWKKAEDFFKKAIDAQLKLERRLHCDTAAMYNNLGYVLYRQERFPEARENFYIEQDIRGELGEVLAFPTAEVDTTPPKVTPQEEVEATVPRDANTVKYMMEEITNTMAEVNLGGGAVASLSPSCTGESDNLIQSSQQKEPELKTCITLPDLKNLSTIQSNNLANSLANAMLHRRDSVQDNKEDMEEAWSD